MGKGLKPRDGRLLVLIDDLEDIFVEGEEDGSAGDLIPLRVDPHLHVDHVANENRGLTDTCRGVSQL